jgi:hypothetical protein
MSFTVIVNWWYTTVDGYTGDTLMDKSTITTLKCTIYAESEPICGKTSTY